MKTEEQLLRARIYLDKWIKEKGLDKQLSMFRDADMVNFATDFANQQEQQSVDIIDTVKELEKYPIADIESTGGFKRRIIELVRMSETDECGTFDLLCRLQFILNEFKAKQSVDWEKINEQVGNFAENYSTQFIQRNNPVATEKIRGNAERHYKAGFNDAVSIIKDHLTKKGK